MKHLHMLMAVIVIGLFLYQSLMALSASQTVNRGVKIASHISYMLIIITGAWMLIQLLSVNAPVQWVLAKIVLLIAAISASIKAFRVTASPPQTKIGIFVAALAYFGIVVLAFTKPENFI